MNKVAKIDPHQEVVPDVPAIVSMIERAARDPAVDIDKMERLLQMQERMVARNAEQAFFAAMTAAQAEMRPVAADSNNPQTRSRYASYAALDRAVRPIYSKHGFSLSFDTEPGAPDGFVRVVCFASCGGHTRKYQVDMPADGKGAKGGDVMTKTHAVGSGMSYGQRYLLKMIFNIAVGEDDDGNRAGGEKITADQAADVQAMIEDIGGDKHEALKRGFLKYMRIEAITDLPANKLKDAIAALEAKRSR
jgi:hypothetical protein